jgi:hypothetical protein
VSAYDGPCSPSDALFGEAQAKNNEKFKILVFMDLAPPWRDSSKRHAVQRVDALLARLSFDLVHSFDLFNFLLV